MSWSTDHELDICCPLMQRCCSANYPSSKLRACSSRSPKRSRRSWAPSSASRARPLSRPQRRTRSATPSPTWHPVSLWHVYSYSLVLVLLCSRDAHSPVANLQSAHREPFVCTCSALRDRVQQERAGGHEGPSCELVLSIYSYCTNTVRSVIYVRHSCANRSRSAMCACTGGEDRRLPRAQAHRLA